MLRRTVSGLQILLLLCVSSWTVSFSFIEVEAIRVLPTDMALVYVYPSYVSASLGETFTISVKIFNLSDNFYTTDQIWERGDPLPPPGTVYNYSLGHLIGLDIRLSWDPEVLRYEDHIVTIPVEAYPEGVLHSPILSIRDEVNGTDGTSLLAQVTLGTSTFSRADADSTVFSMSFTVMAPGITTLNITRADLAAPVSAPFGDNLPQIPHWVEHGEFELFWNRADINNDLKVDIFDVVWICLVYGSTPSDSNWNGRCDIAAPYGVIDLNDLVEAALNYGRVYIP